MHRLLFALKDFLFWGNFQHSFSKSPHQCPQGFIYHCPWVPSVWSSLFELSMEFSFKLRARVAEDSYIPCSVAHHFSFLVRWPPCTHWHIGTVTYQSHWEAKTKLGHQETIVLGCCTVPAYYNYSSLFYIQEISISICFVPRGGGRVGAGQIGPRFAVRVKNSPKNSQLLGLLVLTIDRFLTSVGFYTVCRVNMELHQIHLLFPYIFSW